MVRNTDLHSCTRIFLCARCTALLLRSIPMVALTFQEQNKNRPAEVALPLSLPRFRKKQNLGYDTSL